MASKTSTVFIPAQQTYVNKEDFIMPEPQPERDNKSTGCSTSEIVCCGAWCLFSVICLLLIVAWAAVCTRVTRLRFKVARYAP